MDLVKRAGVKKLLKQHKMRVSGGLLEVVNDSVENMLKKACARAAKNGRSTVMGWDV